MRRASVILAIALATACDPPVNESPTIALTGWLDAQRLVYQIPTDGSLLDLRAVVLVDDDDREDLTVEVTAIHDAGEENDLGVVLGPYVFRHTEARFFDDSVEPYATYPDEGHSLQLGSVIAAPGEWRLGFTVADADGPVAWNKPPPSDFGVNPDDTEAMEDWEHMDALVLQVQGAPVDGDVTIQLGATEAFRNDTVQVTVHRTEVEGEPLNPNWAVRVTPGSVEGEGTPVRGTSSLYNDLYEGGEVTFTVFIEPKLSDYNSTNRTHALATVPYGTELLLEIDVCTDASSGNCTTHTRRVPVGNRPPPPATQVTTSIKVPGAAPTPPPANPATPGLREIVCDWKQAAMLNKDPEGDSYEFDVTLACASDTNACPDPLPDGASVPATNVLARTAAFTTTVEPGQRWSCIVATRDQHYAPCPAEDPNACGAIGPNVTGTEYAVGAGTAPDAASNVAIAFDGEHLVCAWTPSTDPEEDPITYSVSWACEGDAACDDLPDTAESTTASVSLLYAGEDFHGEEVTCAVVASDPWNDAAEAVSAPKLANQPPTHATDLAVLLDEGVPSCSWEAATDPDEPASALTYEVSWTCLSGTCTTPSYPRAEATSPSLLPAPPELDDVWQCTVETHDAFGAYAVGDAPNATPN